MPPRPTTLYRNLLRELPPTPSSLLAQPRSPLHQRIRDSFSSPSPAEKKEERQRRRLAEAEQFTAYLRAQRQYVYLLERYNPGMGMDQEERIRLSARRVGVNLPVEHKPE